MGIVRVLIALPISAGDRLNTLDLRLVTETRVQLSLGLDPYRYRYHTLRPRNTNFYDIPRTGTRHLTTVAYSSVSLYKQSYTFFCLLPNHDPSWCFRNDESFESRYRKNSCTTQFPKTWRRIRRFRNFIRKVIVILMFR